MFFFFFWVSFWRELNISRTNKKGSQRRRIFDIFLRHFGHISAWDLDSLKQISPLSYSSLGEEERKEKRKKRKKKLDLVIFTNFFFFLRDLAPGGFPGPDQNSPRQPQPHPYNQGYMRPPPAYMNPYASNYPTYYPPQQPVYYNQYPPQQMMGYPQYGQPHYLQPAQPTYTPPPKKTFSGLAIVDPKSGETVNKEAMESAGRLAHVTSSPTSLHPPPHSSVDSYTSPTGELKKGVDFTAPRGASSPPRPEAPSETPAEIPATLREAPSPQPPVTQVQPPESKPRAGSSPPTEADTTSDLDKEGSPSDAASESLKKKKKKEFTVPGDEEPSLDLSSSALEGEGLFSFFLFSLSQFAPLPMQMMTLRRRRTLLTETTLTRKARKLWRTNTERIPLIILLGYGLRSLLHSSPF